MSIYISPLAQGFAAKNVRSLGLVLSVEAGLYKMTPYREYSFMLQAHEDFTRVFEDKFVIVMADYLWKSESNLRIGLLAGDKHLVIVGRNAKPTLIDRRWASSRLH